MRAAVFGPVPRLVLAGLIVLGFQNTVVADHPLFGARLSLPLAVAVACGAGSGAERGALAGFVLGLMYDLSTSEPIGQHALAYGAAGMIAGYLLVFIPAPRWWMTAGCVALGAAVGEGLLPGLKMLTGDDGWMGWRLLPVVAIVVVGALALAPLLIPVGRLVTAFKAPRWKVLPE